MKSLLVIVWCSLGCLSEVEVPYNNEVDCYHNHLCCPPTLFTAEDPLMLPLEAWS